MVVVLALVLSLVLAHPALAQTNGFQRDVSPPSYDLVGTGFLHKRSVLQKNLDEASANGYRVVGAFDLGRFLVRKAPHDERYAYIAVHGAFGHRSNQKAVEWLDREMNAAAAAGFRLVPDAVLSDASIAVMEKRVGASPVDVSYTVLSIETEHEIYDIYPRPAIGAGFDTDGLDEELAQMAIAGYRLVAVTTRDVETRTTREPVVGGVLRKILGKVLAVDKHMLRQRLILFFEKDRDGGPAASVRDAARRYHAVIASTEGEFEAGLNRAAKAGYRLLTTAVSAYPQMIGIVEKQESAPPRTYAVIAPSRLSQFTEELSEAAAAGWIVHPHGLLNLYPYSENEVLVDQGFNRVLTILEREEKQTPRSILVLDAIRSSTLARELNEATAGGFDLIGARASNGLMVAVLQRAEHASAVR